MYIHIRIHVVGVWGLGGVTLGYSNRRLDRGCQGGGCRLGFRRGGCRGSRGWRYGDTAPPGGWYDDIKTILYPMVYGCLSIQHRRTRKCDQIHCFPPMHIYSNSPFIWESPHVCMHAPQEWADRGEDRLRWQTLDLLIVLIKGGCMNEPRWVSVDSMPSTCDAWTHSPSIK